MLLTALLMPLAILASFESSRIAQKEYYAWMLLLLAAMLGVFIARDLLLFYIFFELTLIPMFFIIGIWGGPERRYAAGKFFLFTFTGSVFTLAAMIYLGHAQPARFDLDQVDRSSRRTRSDRRPSDCWVLLAFLAGFAVKVPLFPVHTWLPLAHTEAPTAGSVILAGVLLKLGTYGLLPLGRAASADCRIGDESAFAVADSLDRCALRHRHHLRRAGRLGAAGHQEAGRLFIGLAPGLLRAGTVRAERRSACRARSCT